MVKTLKRWLRRYGLAEIFAILGVYAGYFLSEHFADVHWIAAYAGAMGENVGFYGTLVVQRVRAKENLWHILTEFGPAEILDSLIIRPLSLFVGAEMMGPMVGLLVGKLAGDVVFYIPVVLTHEWMRKYRSQQD
ncbi:MAG: hypothetical protein I8H75_04570 [Myxococcaceae bacterium]|nr:hypothetical protein [Myxococcaceae bacterium]